MYESFYGFKEKPFNITPDPRFLYLSRTHKEALAQLIYGIRERKGFVVLSGEVGTGKTTIVRALLERLDENCQVAYIFNTRLSVVDFLKYVCHDFGLRIKGESKIDYLIKLHDFLIESHNDGKTATLIVDEAQNLDASLFEEIRMLTNLETSSHKLLQIFLVGQPELNEHLEKSELWQLKQRISTRYHLISLDRQETKEYIETRMRVAGAKRLNCFTEGAVQKIYDYSHGIPRMINNLCDNSLLIGYAMDAPVINEKIVRESGADLNLEVTVKSPKTDRRTKTEGDRRHSIVYASLVIILIGLVTTGVILFLSGKFNIPQRFLKPFETVKPFLKGESRDEGKDTGLENIRVIIEEKDKTEPKPQSRADVPGDADTGERLPLKTKHASTEAQSKGGLIPDSLVAEFIPLKGPLQETNGRSGDSEVYVMPAGASGLLTRETVIREGDTVSRIILREFGRVDGPLLEAVRRVNPELEDLDEISVGQRIRVPIDPDGVRIGPGTSS
jgi:general secretion pathway protein A